MRIRSIRPEFWSSEDIAALPWAYRLIYIGLWSYVDDNGVGRDNVKLIAADLFPLEDEPPTVIIHGALTEFSRREMITRYEVNGKQYLHVSRFHQHQKINRPSEGRYPLPTREDAVIHDILTEPSVSAPVGLALGEGEKGRRGEVLSSSEIASDPDPDEEDPDDRPRDEVRELCESLAEQVRHNGHKVPAKLGKQWFRPCRLLLDRDEKSPESVREVMAWATADPFWSTNIRSMQSLREKFSTLQGQANSRRPQQRQQSPNLLPFTPDAPPPEIADDPEAYDRWMRDQHARRSA